MNEIMYSFRDNNVRVVMKDNEPWFVAKDVCEVLGHTNTTMALQNLDIDDRAKFNLGHLEVNLVNESGLYSLIMGSRKEEARQFKRWVTSEVLPSIRKRGIYATEDVIKKTLDDPQFMIELLQNLQKEREERKKAEGTVAILTHVNKTYTATEIAKELGFKSAMALNKELASRKIQFYQNGTWVLYSKYSDKGYVHIKQTVLDTGKVVYDRRFTQMGREFLIKLFEVSING